MKKYRANLGVNRVENGAATAAPVKHKCYSFTIIMYYLKVTYIPHSLLRLSKDRCHGLVMYFPVNGTP